MGENMKSYLRDKNKIKAPSVSFVCDVGINCNVPVVFAFPKTETK